MAMRADALAVMAKAPVPGAVKTRLAPALGAEQAAELARALLVDQLAHLQFYAADLYLAFAPADAGALIEQLAPTRYRCFPQEGDGLGMRMQAIFAKLFADGYHHVVLIGADLPAVPLRFFEEAYAFLHSAVQRVVLGPSHDGGYFLIGCNRLTPQIFAAMDWGHGEVLAQTVAKLAALKIDYHLLPEWFDVDTPDDLLKLRSELDTALAKAMPATATLMTRLELKRG
jgi:rSAM/selenodomain-associated transferase 1